MKPDGPSILMVDDDIDICRNLSDILTDLDYDVDVAHDGEAALQLVRRKHYDLALLDLRMPGMDGLTLYREIKKLSAGTEAIIVTAYASGATVEDALEAGALQILTKPIDFPRLLRLVDEALDRPMLMVVDDDRELCANLGDVLRDPGYRVVVAHDEAEAALHLDGRLFQVVLIDLKLPCGDGAGVFRRVRRTNPQARTILITGLQPEMDALVTRVLNEGADAVCYKPFDVRGLLAKIERLIR